MVKDQRWGSSKEFRRSKKWFLGFCSAKCWKGDWWSNPKVPNLSDDDWRIKPVDKLLALINCFLDKDHKPFLSWDKSLCNRVDGPIDGATDRRTKGSSSGGQTVEIEVDFAEIFDVEDRQYRRWFHPGVKALDYSHLIGITIKKTPKITTIITTATMITTKATTDLKWMLRPHALIACWHDYPRELLKYRSSSQPMDAWA